MVVGRWKIGETMLNDEFDFGFAVDWMRKDLNICLDEANSNKAKFANNGTDNSSIDIQDMNGGR